MFTVTEQMRLRLRREVKAIMKGEPLGVRNLHIPAYLAGDGVRLGKNPRSVETMLNPVDPGANAHSDLTHTTGDTDETHRLQDQHRGLGLE